MRLPIELRHMIWELVIPSRLIVPKVSGFVYSPGPPAIAQACRDSRAVALKHGGPYSFDTDKKCGSTAWYDSSRDVILWAGRIPRRWLWSNNRICPDIWQAATSLTLLARKVDDVKAWAENFFFLPYSSYYRRSYLPSYANLRQIDVLLQSEGYFANANWAPKTVQAIFGNESVILIDLRDTDEVKRVQKIFNADYRTRAGIRALGSASGILASPGCPWPEIQAEIKLQWLKCNYQQDTVNAPKSGGPTPVKVENYEWDDTNEWIKATLEKLREIRPVFMIRKKGEDQIAMRSRHRGSRRPNVCWDDGKWWEGANHSVSDSELFLEYLMFETTRHYPSSCVGDQILMLIAVVLRTPPGGTLDSV